MAAPEDEIQVLRQKNIELVQKVQHWKMLAAQRDNEKLDLMKELNEMRLTLAVSILICVTLIPLFRIVI